MLGSTGGGGKSNTCRPSLSTHGSFMWRRRHLMLRAMMVRQGGTVTQRRVDSTERTSEMTGRRPLDAGGTMSDDAPRFSALIVDDNFALREAIARSLAHDGWDVTTAPDGLKGLDALRGHAFDAGIPDVHTPGRGGAGGWGGGPPAGPRGAGG